MNTVHLGLAIYVLALAVLVYKTRRTYDRAFAIIFGGFVIAILVAFMTLITGLVINDQLPMKTVNSGPYTLVAMHSTDGVAGNFVYGTGSMTGARYYNVMVRNDDGSMSGYVVDGDNTTRIVESSDLRDHGEWTIKTVEHDYSGFWGGWAFGSSYAQSYNTLRVPVNTVVHDFSAK